MPARKMRVELFDEDGNRYTISFEGQITREKALRLLDLVELLGGVPTGRGNEINRGVSENEFSKYDKVRIVVQKHFPLVWFTSHDVQLAYEQEFREPIGLSTVATYLSRMSSRGLLLRAGASKTLKYKLSTSYPKAIIERQTP
ncbi:MAG: hypothetical protein ACPL0C_01220 [Candidatus Bathyarchaeales archaeon]